MKPIDDIYFQVNVYFPMLGTPFLCRLDKQVFGVTIKTMGLLRRAGSSRSDVIKTVSKIYFAIRFLLKWVDRGLMQFARR